MAKILCTIAKDGGATRRRMRHVVINAVFAVRRLPLGGWKLTHRPTGYAAGEYPSQRKAIAAARALLKRYPRKRWMFTDPAAASAFKDAKNIIRQFGVIA